MKIVRRSWRDDYTTGARSRWIIHKSYKEWILNWRWRDEAYVANRLQSMYSRLDKIYIGWGWGWKRNCWDVRRFIGLDKPFGLFTRLISKGWPVSHLMEHWNRRLLQQEFYTLVILDQEAWAALPFTYSLRGVTFDNLINAACVWEILWPFENNEHHMISLHDSRKIDQNTNFADQKRSTGESDTPRN